jgi:hypothetical protein
LAAFWSIFFRIASSIAPAGTAVAGSAGQTAAAKPPANTIRIPKLTHWRFIRLSIGLCHFFLAWQNAHAKPKKHAPSVP